MGGSLILGNLIIGILIVVQFCTGLRAILHWGSCNSARAVHSAAPRARARARVPDGS